MYFFVIATVDPLSLYTDPLSSNPLHIDQSQPIEQPKSDTACIKSDMRARTAELCRMAFERLTCSCSHVRRGRSLMDRCINLKTWPMYFTLTKGYMYTCKTVTYFLPMKTTPYRMPTAIMTSAPMIVLSPWHITMANIGNL